MRTCRFCIFFVRHDHGQTLLVLTASDEETSQYRTILHLQLLFFVFVLSRFKDAHHVEPVKRSASAKQQQTGNCGNNRGQRQQSKQKERPASAGQSERSAAANSANHGRRRPRTPTNHCSSSITSLGSHSSNPVDHGRGRPRTPTDRSASSVAPLGSHSPGVYEGHKANDATTFSMPRAVSRVDVVRKERGGSERSTGGNRGGEDQSPSVGGECSGCRSFVAPGC